MIHVHQDISHLEYSYIICIAFHIIISQPFNPHQDKYQSGEIILTK